MANAWYSESILYSETGDPHILLNEMNDYSMHICSSCLHVNCCLHILISKEQIENQDK